MSSLKERKEQFVSGLDGGSIEEINLVTSISLISYACWNLFSNERNNLFLDFLINWVTMLLSITRYSDNIPLLYILIIIPTILCNFNQIKNLIINCFKSKDSKNNDNYKEYQLPKIPFITAYRSSMLVITMIAILAVDFPIFPRRFAKVETWGTSMMDLGVGSFVFSNGLVSSRSLIKEKMNLTKKTSFIKKFLSSIRSCASLLIIGLLRTYFVKNLEYQEHVTEYGVHWNFFLTLAFVPPFLVLVDPITNYIPRIILAMSIAIIYELAQFYNESALLKFMILGERTNLFSANREGIMSFFGYCVIFLCGQNTGFYVLGNKPTRNNLYKPSAEILDSDPTNTRPHKKKSSNNNTNGKRSKRLSAWDKLTSVTPLGGLAMWTLIFIALYQLVISVHPFNVSRRFANLPYTLWVVAYNQGFITAYCLLGSLLGNSDYHSQVPVTLEAANNNGLVMFLASNVLTGLVNMAIPTIDCTDLQALAVLVVYSAMLCALGLLLHRNRIYIKL